jgi:sulfite reductase (ferredoxin)
MTILKKENKVERAKREKDPLDCFEDILRYAKEGFASISEDDLDVRLRWYGLYTQRPAEDGYFMLRVKIPNGALTAAQLERIGELSVRFARNTGDITTRQGIQFHFVRIEDVPQIFEGLAAVGLTTSGACGDIPRNVTGCPLAGIDAHEIVNAEPLVDAVHRHFLDNREFSNLPRKFKITISGCSGYCTGHQINDIGLVAVKRADGQTAFDLWVGGGLGAKERFAERLGAHVFEPEIVEVCHHIGAIFREYGNRRTRPLARLKFLLADWGAEKFRAELETRLGRKLTDGEAPQISLSAERTHLGSNRQKNGLFYVGAAALRGRLSGRRMIETARLAREYGSGVIRLTTAQNFVILDVRPENVGILEKKLDALELSTDPSVFRSGTLSCTGRQFCKLALVETKDRAAEIVTHLEAVFPEFQEPFRISVTGCPNSCAHYQVCDIGLVGDFINTPNGKSEAFRVYLGGHLGNEHAFGRELRAKVPADEIKFYVEHLIEVFLAERAAGESLHRFLARHETTELESLVDLSSLAGLAEAAAI